MVYQIISATLAISLDNIKVWINEKIAEEKAKKVLELAKEKTEE
jgi:hypothetical protein